MRRDVVVTGAGGWLGGLVGALLAERGWRVTGVSRTPEQARQRRPEWAWTGIGPELEEAVERAGVVVNLAGRNVFEQPWTPQFVAEMRRSRIETTARIAAALERSAAPDRILVSASGAPIYGDTGEATVTEDGPVSRELVTGALSIDWEAAARAAERHGTRVVLLRIGVVLGAGNGIFPVLRQSFAAGAGTVYGSGGQWVPWIHERDAVRLTVEAVVDPAHRGPLNLVGPRPVRHADMVAALGDVLGVPHTIRVPDEQVAAMLGGASEMLLISQRLATTRATGFTFAHPELVGALEQLVRTGARDVA